MVLIRVTSLQGPIFGEEVFECDEHCYNAPDKCEENFCPCSGMNQAVGREKAEENAIKEGRRLGALFALDDLNIEQFQVEIEAISSFQLPLEVVC